MNQFVAFNRSACLRLRNEMQALLDKYAAETGIEIHVGNMKFTSENVKITVEAKKPGAQSQRDQKLDAALQYQARLDMLSLDEIKGKRLVGYNSRAHKMPYIYLDVATGKRYKCSKTLAKMYFITPKSIANKAA
jgi:hypothetical protein